MAVPKKKTSKSKRNQRRSHHAIKGVNIVFNKETGEPQLQHHVSIDGYYKGKKVIVEKVKADDQAVTEAQEAVEKVVEVKEEAKEEAAKKDSKTDEQK